MLKFTRSMTLMLSLLVVAQPRGTNAQPTTGPTTREVERSADNVAANSRPEIRVRRPPPSGAPRGEGTAASRGDENDLPQPILFAENTDAGITISPNPVLYFYIPASTKNRAVATLSDQDEKTTIGVQLFDSGFAKSGIYRVQISDLKEPLKPGRTYVWTVSIKSPKGNNAYNSLAVALVRYQPDTELSAKIANLTHEERARVLGENAIWYDAIAALSEAIDANPTDAFLRAERTRLLTERQKENAASFEQMPESR